MLRIRLVGELRVELDGRPLETIASGRARSLLAWLAYHPGLHPRSRVASVFWPDVLESSARASLRTTLALARRALGAEDVVVAGREHLGIEERPDVWIDVREIGRLADAGDLDGALALCDGDLLTDLEDDWVLSARDAHRDRVVELLAAAGDRAEAAGEPEEATRHARRRLELDPLSEDAARVLMRRLAAAGDAAAAVAIFETFGRTLRRELGMAPSAETRRAADELRSALPAAVPDQPLPDALVRPEHAPLVGRREQLDALRAAWRRARAGAAAVVTLEGAAGSGKTRLLSALAEELRRDGATVLAGRCHEHGMVAFAPFTEALRPWVTAAPDTLPNWVAGELARLLPELAPGAHAADGAPPLDARHRLLEAVAAVIGQATKRAPVLLVVEDLHWADPATLQMLAHVVRSVGWAPLLVAGSIREEDAAVPALQDLLSELVRARRITRVPVAGLAAAEVGRLAGAWLGAEVAAELAAVLHRRTGGNPLFVEELVRQLVETHPGATGPALVAAARTDVPAGVRAVIDRRLGRLPALAAQAVRMAAVAGEDFALADVAQACETGDEEVAEALDAVVAAGLVDESTAPGTYRFGHALVREAVLATAGGTRRALLHRRMAAVLQALPDERRERRVPELARHLLDARPLVDAAEAARWALRAAAQATRGLAYEDAAAVLERAVDGELDAHDALRGELLLALGDARLRAGDTPAATRSFQEAAGVARAIGAPELLARAALGAAGLTVSIAAIRADVRALLEEALAAVGDDAALRPLLLSRLAIELYYESPVTVREALSAEALAGGRRRGGRALLEALGARHVALWSPAHTEERLAIADELIAAAAEAGDHEAELQGLNWRVADLFELGDAPALRAAIDAHERLAEELRLPGYTWYAPLWHASLALLAGRVDESEQRWEAGRRMAAAAQDDNGVLLFEAQRLALRSMQDRLTEADDAVVRRQLARSPARGGWLAALALTGSSRRDDAAVREALALAAAELPTLPLDVNWLYAMTGLGAAAAKLGDQRVAAIVYPRLLPYGHRTVSIARGCFCTGSAWLALGLLAAALGERDAAAEHLAAAAAANDAIGATEFAAAARLGLARLDPDRAGADAPAAPPSGYWEIWRL